MLVVSPDHNTVSHYTQYNNKHNTRGGLIVFNNPGTATAAGTSSINVLSHTCRLLSGRRGVRVRADARGRRACLDATILTVIAVATGASLVSVP